MACKKCKKNATKLTNALVGEKRSTYKRTKSKSGKTGIEKDMEWLEEGEGKLASDWVKLRGAENLILIFLLWTPLVIGYITIIRLLWLFFTS